MRILDSVSDANREYEAIDVQNNEYIFLDDHGYLLKPVLTEPVKKEVDLLNTGCRHRIIQVGADKRAKG